jgi:hypothetical protein
MAATEKLLILICSITRFQVALVYMMGSSQIRCLTLESCHCSWLNIVVIAFDPDGPKRNTPKEVPNFHLFAIFWGNLFPSSNFAKFMHNKRGPPPCPPSLNAIPKFILDRLVCAREAKNILLGYWSHHNASPPLIYNNNVCATLSTWMRLSFPEQIGSQTWDQ